MYISKKHMALYSVLAPGSHESLSVFKNKLVKDSFPLSTKAKLI